MKEQHYHPSTLMELVDILEQTLSHEALEDLRDLKHHALVDTDLDLGRFVRERWILGNQNKRALYQDCHRENPLLVNHGRSDARNLSLLAIMQLWERLQDNG